MIVEWFFCIMSYGKGSHFGLAHFLELIPCRSAVSIFSDIGSLSFGDA